MQKLNPKQEKSQVNLLEDTPTVDTIALATAEALCSIDEDNKHTDEIDKLLQTAKEHFEDDSRGCEVVEFNPQMAEVLVSELLLTTEGKKAVKILHQFVNSNPKWLYKSLGMASLGDDSQPYKMKAEVPSLLYTMFHIRDRPFDQVSLKNFSKIALK